MPAHKIQVSNNMKTLKQVIADNQDKKTLINAVINHIGVSSVKDVINHGADAGFSGFIYYRDTHKFAIRHRKAITAWIEEVANDLGEEVPNMVAGFGVFRRSKMDAEDRKELYAYIGGGKCEQSTLTNIMAWFALEEVCRLFDN